MPVHGAAQWGRVAALASANRGEMPATGRHRGPFAAANVVTRRARDPRHRYPVRMQANLTERVLRGLYSAALYLLVLGSFLVGALVCLLVFLVDRIRLGLELKTLRTRYAALEDEALSLRTIPLNHPQNQFTSPTGQSLSGQ